MLVSHPPHPPVASTMSSKRIPLANNPNAANSPFRNATAKRSRAQVEGKDAENVYSPPKKKQLIGIEGNGTRRAQHISPDDREGRVFLGKADGAASNAFVKKLAAAREARQPQPRPAEREAKPQVADVDTIKQWRKHYRKVFPTFVFYFESLPADISAKSSKQIQSLGAREEKFFSKAVTHIVTTRAIPPSPEQDASNNGRTNGANGHSTQRTINPSLLERGTDALAQAFQRGSRQVAELNAPRGRSADVLTKARELNMKIWALEKFERMMHTMFEFDVTEEDDYHHQQQLHRRGQAKEKTEQHLAQLLRHEKEKNIAAERPLFSDIVHFRGNYIYVHDIDEKTKPVMVREYKTPQHKEEGEWPQFRSVPLPRCPFLEDPTLDRKAARELREQEKRQKQAQMEEALALARSRHPRTRAAAATLEASQERVPTASAPKPVPAEEDNSATVRQHARNTSTTSVPLKSFEPPAVKKTSTNTSLDSMLPQMTSTRPNIRPGYEPQASGLQHANVTSAIRSQMISSTSAVPAIRATTSKDILQRRAVERRTNLSTTSVPSVTDGRAAVNNDQRTARTTRRKPELEKIHEEEREHHHRNSAPKERVAVQRDPKPGYCENCRDKYDDFHEHIESRKHKKFALTTDNWTELDDLLKKLVRH